MEYCNKRVQDKQYFVGGNGTTAQLDPWYRPAAIGWDNLTAMTDDQWWMRYNFLNDQ